MTYDDDKNEYTLTSGRRLYANNGIIGINGELKVYDGYDGNLGGAVNWPTITEAEKTEICDHMIALWQKRKEKPLPGPEDDE